MLGAVTSLMWPDPHPLFESESELQTTSAFQPSLPFACDLPDTWSGPQSGMLKAHDVLSVSRVVTSIPDLVAATAPAMLLAAIRTAATYARRAATAYQNARTSFVVRRLYERREPHAAMRLRG